MDVIVNILNDMFLDMNKNRLYRKNKEQFLTEKEKRLLLVLTSGKGGMVSHMNIKEAVWPERSAAIKRNNILQLVFKLRRKLILLDVEDVILTEKGRGYRLNEIFLTEQCGEDLKLKDTFRKKFILVTKMSASAIIIFIAFMILMRLPPGTRGYYRKHIYHSSRSEHLHDNGRKIQHQQ